MFLIICSAYNSDANLYTPAEYLMTKDENKAKEIVEKKNQEIKEKQEAYRADMVVFDKFLAENPRPYFKFFKGCVDTQKYKDYKKLDDAWCVLQKQAWSKVTKYVDDVWSYELVKEV